MMKTSKFEMHLFRKDICDIIMMTIRFLETISVFTPGLKVKVL